MKTNATTVIVTDNIKAERAEVTRGVETTNSVWTISVKRNGAWDFVGTTVLPGEMATLSQIRNAA